MAARPVFIRRLRALCLDTRLVMPRITTWRLRWLALTCMFADACVLQPSQDAESEKAFGAENARRHRSSGTLLAGLTLLEANHLVQPQFLEQKPFFRFIVHDGWAALRSSEEERVGSPWLQRSRVWLRWTETLLAEINRVLDSPEHWTELSRYAANEYYFGVATYVHAALEGRALSIDIQNWKLDDVRWGDFVALNYAYGKTGWQPSQVLLPDEDVEKNLEEAKALARLRPEESQELFPLETRGLRAEEFAAPKACVIASLEVKLSRNVETARLWHPEERMVPACVTGLETLRYEAHVASGSEGLEVAKEEGQQLRDLLRRLCRRERDQQRLSLPRPLMFQRLGHILLPQEACDGGYFETRLETRGQCGVDTVVVREGYLQRWMDDARIQVEDRKNWKVPVDQDLKPATRDLLYIGSGEGLD